IVRPSLLLGDRKETRWVERMSEPFARFLPRSVRGIHVQKVGRALALYARSPAQGKRVVPSEELQDIA
ncbi:MAG TPA: hypothetical protein VI299_23725, partial [Polyangiales bacterium]